MTNDIRRHIQDGLLEVASQKERMDSIGKNIKSKYKVSLIKSWNRKELVTSSTLLHFLS